MPRTGEGTTRARALLAGPLPIWLICGLALLLRLWGLDSKALWSDEIHRLTWSKGFDFDRVFGVFPDETGIRLLPSSAFEALAVASRHTPPLYSLILNVWLRQVGDSGDFVVRLPSAILSAGAVFVVFLALRKRFGRAAALLAAAFTALSPFQIFYAQEVNHYAPAYFLVALSFLAYYRFLDSRSVRDGLLWALVSVAALYCHYHCGIVTLFQWATLVWPYRLPWRTHLPPALLVALGFAPYIPAVQIQLPGLTSATDSGGFLGAPYFFEHVRSHLVQPLLGPMAESIGWVAAAPIILLSCLLVLGALRRLPRVESLALLVNFLGPVLLLYSLFWGLRSNAFLWTRYQLLLGFSFPALLGVGLASLDRLAHVTSAAVLALFALGNVYRSELLREDWRTVATVIENAPAEGEPVLVYRASLTYSLARYLHEKDRLFGIETTPDLETLLDDVLETESGTDGTWYVEAWSERNGTNERIRHYLWQAHEHCGEDRSVQPGSVSLSLIHCTGRHAPLHWLDLAGETSGEKTWMMPHPGPRVEAGWIELRNRTSVTGWAWSTSGLRAIRIVRNGVTLAEFPHPGLERLDVRRHFGAAPADLTSRSGFRVAIRPSDGDMHEAKIFGVRADGSLMEIGPK